MADLDNMALGELIGMLKDFSGCHDLYHVTTFKGFREIASGGSKELTIEVWDGGPANPRIRYHVIATDEDSRMASGIPNGRLSMSIAGVHWTKLDKDPEPDEVQLFRSSQE
jgi:hypothetical protein